MVYHPPRMVLPPPRTKKHRDGCGEKCSAKIPDLEDRILRLQAFYSAMRLFRPSTRPSGGRRK